MSLKTYMENYTYICVNEKYKNDEMLWNLSYYLNVFFFCSNKYLKNRSTKSYQTKHYCVNNSFCR